jgi:hypothetical protein
VNDALAGKLGPRRVRILAAPPHSLKAGSVRALRCGFLAAIAVFVVGVFQILKLESPHRGWLFLLTCVAGFLLFVWLDRGFRGLYEPLLRDRQHELSEKLLRGETLRVRGTPGVFVPMMVSLMLLVVVLPTGVATTLPGRLLLVAGIALLAVFWYWAVPRLRAPILELDRDGLRTKKLGRVPWQDIELAQLRVNGSVDNGFIASHVLQLEFVIDRHPRPSRGLRRWAQYFFRGMREREARIPLRNPSENALVVLNLVMFLIRNTPRYQEQRHPRRAGPPQSLANFQPHDLPGLPLSRAAVAARAAQVATRRGTTLELPRPRVQRVRMLPRRRKSKYPQWFGTAVICVLAVSMITGTRVDFFLSDPWLRTSPFVALVPAAWPMWWVARAVFLNPDETQQLSSPAARALVGWTLIPFLVYAASWIIVARTIPDFITRFSGRSFSETHILSKRYERSRRSCDYRVTGPPFTGQFGRNYYCAWISEFERLPNKGPMVIRGRKTWFGRHVDSIEAADPLWSRQ